jgi:hypothetical protein
MRIAVPMGLPRPKITAALPNAIKITPDHKSFDRPIFFPDTIPRQPPFFRFHDPHFSTAWTATNGIGTADRRAPPDLIERVGQVRRGKLFETLPVRTVKSFRIHTIPSRKINFSAA